MLKQLIKRLLKAFGIDTADVYRWSIEGAAREQGLVALASRLRTIVPDISHQQHDIGKDGWSSPFWEAKVRVHHAFQMRLMERAVRLQNKSRMNVVDIGDSAGTHLIYIKALCSDIAFRTLSVNLDARAIESIRSKGLEAIHCAAENLDLGNESIDLFVTFQMVEHLMNPALFFRRLAAKGKADYLLVTVPYREKSQVGFCEYAPLRNALMSSEPDWQSALAQMPQVLHAEGVHVFELSPMDWKMIMAFSGWLPVFEEIYIQYPQKHPLRFLKYAWAKNDFEGYWGVLLKRDLTFSNRYKDWQE